MVATDSRVFCFFFFFSSRRRHTRFDCDWSSDVCSSDLLRELGDRCDKVIVETLSHLLRADQLERAVRFVDELEVAFGLESTNERVLRYAVNKVWGLPEHAKAAALCHEAGAAVKTYLLVKPPFLTEHESIEDAVRDRKSTRLNSSHSQISYAV